MKWFNNPGTLEELKNQYKKLAMEHHPDLGGSVTDMQEINNEYDLLFASLKNVHKTVDGKMYTSEKEVTETPDEFKNIINALISLAGIKIEICGKWLWITGNTKPHKEILKSLKFRWSKSKAAWYYHTADYTKVGKKTFTLNEIRALYGSEVVKANPQLKLEIV